MSSRRVITVHLHIAVVHYSCAKIILDKNSAAPLHCCDCLGISSWMCGADCWPVLESGTENISASDSSSEAPRFFVAGKYRAAFPAVQLNKFLNGFSPLPNSFFICSLKISFLPFLMDYAGHVARFSEAFYKCSYVESEETNADER